MECVPPVLLSHHFGEEWVPVFMRDQKTQQEYPSSPEPLSDAYLSGMSTRKRLCVRQLRPPTELDKLIETAVREATAGSSQTNPPRANPPQASSSQAYNSPQTATTETSSLAEGRPLHRAFVEHFRASVNARASYSSDYNARRFLSTHRFLIPLTGIAELAMESE